jgi:hypothetical protein
MCQSVPLASLAQADIAAAILAGSASDHQSCRRLDALFGLVAPCRPTYTSPPQSFDRRSQRNPIVVQQNSLLA